MNNIKYAKCPRCSCHATLSSTELMRCDDCFYEIYNNIASHYTKEQLDLGNKEAIEEFLKFLSSHNMR